MNPRLFVFKGKFGRNVTTTERRIRFAVIDQDKPPKYPVNFICILPQHMNVANVNSSKFGRIFRENKSDLAKRLLFDALQNEKDPKVKREIKGRLAQLKLVTV